MSPRSFVPPRAGRLLDRDGRMKRVLGVSAAPPPSCFRRTTVAKKKAAKKSAKKGSKKKKSRKAPATRKG